MSHIIYPEHEQFEQRARKLFCTWAYHWVQTAPNHYRKDKTTSDFLSIVLLVLYRTEVFRNPTVLEWVEDYQQFSCMKIEPSIIREHIRQRPNYPEMVGQLYARWWSLAGYSKLTLSEALQEFSKTCGEAFLGKPLPSNLDWTKELQIQKIFFTGMKKVLDKIKNSCYPKDLRGSR